MRILITGASGFVGTHLVGALSRSHQIIAVVRTPAPVPDADELKIVPTINADTDWSDALRGVDMAIHLAARVHVMNETATDPRGAYDEINVQGTRALAQACVDHGVKRLIFMSSIKVNGDATYGTPFASEDPASPSDPYGQSKWDAEQALRELAANSALEVITLRPTVIYGMGVKGNIKRIVSLVETGIPVPLGSVRNRRTMLSIANLITWVEAALAVDKPPQGPVLIGDPEPISTRDLVACVAAGLGRPARLLPVPVRLLSVAGRLAGRSSTVQRLIADLEVQPTFDAFPGIQQKLVPAQRAMISFGRQTAQKDPLSTAQNSVTEKDQ